MTPMAELLVILGVDTTRLKQARKEMEEFGGSAQKSLDRTEKSASSLASTLKKVAIGIGGLYATRRTFNQIISASIEQEEALQRVETALKSTGGVSGKTAIELEKMAGSLQKVTTFGDETIMGLQALLLTFKDIKGDVFDQATKAALNLSVAMKQGLKESAVMLGKALNDPIMGLTAMRRVGIQFTKDQEEQIRALIKSGEVMKAQKIILAELKSQFGGMARAMRETLGGAIQSLKNAWGDLFEMNKRENFTELRQKIEALTEVISSDKFKRGADIFFGAIVEGAMKAMQGIVFLAENMEALINVIKGMAIAWASLKIMTIVGHIIAFAKAMGGLTISFNAFLIPFGIVVGKFMLLIGSVYALIRLFGNLTDRTKSMTEAQRELNREVSSYLGMGKGLLYGLDKAGRVRTPGGYEETDWRNLALEAKYGKKEEAPWEPPDLGPDLESAKSKANELAKALQRYRDGIAELTLSVADYQRYQLDQWFANEAKAIGMVPPELQKLYDLRKAIIAQEEYAQSAENKTQEIIRALQQEAESLRLTETAQKAMNLAREAGVEVGSDLYRSIYAQVEANEALRESMNLASQVESIRESLLTQEESIRVSYQRQIDIVQSAIDAQVLAVDEGTLLISDLYRQMGQELEAISEETFNEKMASAFEGWANSFSSQLNDLLWKSDVTFEEIAQSFARMITQMLIQFMIVEPFVKWARGLFGFSDGGVLSMGRIVPFAQGGIVTKPTIFPMAGGMGLMGEAGPEAVMPLKRGRDGRLGVEAEGGGDTVNVTMNINAVDAQSFVQLARTNKGVFESLVLENLMRDGAIRKAIRGVA